MTTTKQSGSALIVSLLILLVMTLIGINSISTSTLEEKMSANDRNHKIVFQNAESDLKSAETTITALNGQDLKNKFASNTVGYRSADESAFNYQPNGDWVNGTNCITQSNNVGVYTTDSCYIVEEIGEIDTFTAQSYDGGVNSEPIKYVTKITVRSSAQNGSSAAVLQSTYQTLIIQ